MAKTGPTPHSGDKANVVRRVPTPELLETALRLPEPRPEWTSDTQAAYRAYQESTAARVLRQEDLDRVLTLFGMIDQQRQGLRLLTGDPEDDLKKLQGLKILDGMIARLSGDLGIGPLARTRLGIAQIEGAERAAKLVESNQEKTGADDY